MTAQSSSVPDASAPDSPLLDCRSDFFDFGGVTYLNCAYMGPTPRVAVEAGEAALALEASPHLIGDGDFFAVPDAYRQEVARLIGAAPADVAVTDSTTHGVMLLVGGLDWRPGDEVVVPRGEFPANRFPWLSLAARGVVVKEVEVPAGPAGVEAVAAALTPRTRAVSAAWVAYQSGSRRDVAGIGALCRERGVLFAIDGSQGVGGLAFDLRQTPCDLLACSGYKWMLGPYGVGFAWVSPALGERLASVNVNWFAIRGARDFNRLSRCELDFEPGARRFDVNETASFVKLATAVAALRYLNGVTPVRAEQHVRALQDRLIAGLPAGFRPVTDGDASARSNILCLRGATEEATERAYHRLAEMGVFVSRREGSIRLAPYVYNVEADVDRVLAGLAEGAERSRTPRPAPIVGESLPVELLTPAGAPTPGPFVGRWVSLLPLDPDRDVDDLYAGSHGDEERERLWTYMMQGPFADRSAMHAWLRGRAASTDPLFVVVVDNATSRRVGLASFMRIRREMRSLELGNIWYAPSHQRGRTNTEAIYLMLCEAFDRLGYRRVEWKCDSLNRRSRAAALRLGFRYEGLFRQHMVLKGRNRDTAWFSLLDREWPAVKHNLETWLASAPGTVSLTALNRRLVEEAPAATTELRS